MGLSMQSKNKNDYNVYIENNYYWNSLYKIIIYVCDVNTWNVLEPRIEMNMYDPCSFLGY